MGAELRLICGPSPTPPSPSLQALHFLCLSMRSMQPTALRTITGRVGVQGGYVGGWVRV